MDHVTLSLSYVTDKQTFDWSTYRSMDVVMATVVQRYDRTRCLVTFLHRVFCDTESSQFIHRNDLKIKRKSHFMEFYPLASSTDEKKKKKKKKKILNCFAIIM